MDFSNCGGGCFIPSDSLTRKWKIAFGKTSFLYNKGGFHFHVSNPLTNGRMKDALKAAEVARLSGQSGPMPRKRELAVARNEVAASRPVA